MARRKLKMTKSAIASRKYRRRKKRRGAGARVGAGASVGAGLRKRKGKKGKKGGFLQMLIPLIAGLAGGGAAAAGRR